MLGNLLVLAVAVLVGRKALELAGNKNRSRGWMALAVAAVLAAAVIFATAASLAGLTYPWTVLPAVAGAVAGGLAALRYIRGLSRLRSKWDIAADGS